MKPPVSSDARESTMITRAENAAERTGTDVNRHSIVFKLIVGIYGFPSMTKEQAADTDFRQCVFKIGQDE